MDATTDARRSAPDRPAIPQSPRRRDQAHGDTGMVRCVRRGQCAVRCLGWRGQDEVLLRVGERRAEVQIELEASQATGSASPASPYQPTQERQPAPTRAKRQYHRRINRAEFLERQRERMRKRRLAEAKRRPMSEYHFAVIQRRARMKAILIELASLGQRQADAARLLGVSPTFVSDWCRALGISMPRRQAGSSRLVQVIRQEFGKKTYAEIAEMTGSTPKSVGVIACKLGLTSGARHDAAKFTRGFPIPDDKWPEYMALRHEFCNALTAVETGQVLGLVPRQPIQGPTP